MANNFSSLYSKGKENLAMTKLVELTQKECYRPKLDHLKVLLAKEISQIENDVTNIFVIAGTNGKGETAHCLRYLLEREGKSVSMWSSPHVQTILERLYHSSSPIGYEQFMALLETYEKDIVENQLSFYEALFYIYIKYLNDNLVDNLILEVGLGGKYDAVNVFSNPYCAITSISLDHTQILGKSLKGIMEQKYGIARRGGRLISAVEQTHLTFELSKWCKRDEVELLQLEPCSESLYFERNQQVALKLYLQSGGKNVKDLCFPVSKGRREKVTIRQRDFIFIGAHNLDGHRKMLSYLRKEYSQESIVCVLSFSSGREEQVEFILKLYDSYPCLVDQCLVTNFQGDRSIETSKLNKLLRGKSRLELDWNRFLSEEFKHKKIVITGSYFFIAQFQEFLDSIDDNHVLC